MLKDVQPFKGTDRTDKNCKKEFASYLLERGIFFTRDFKVGDTTYDFRIGHYLVEINSYATHNSSQGVYSSTPVPEQYHREKTLNALESGFTCVHIFDWVNPDLILYGITTGTLRIVDTGKSVKHIYDYKKKSLTNEESENTVIIYDDGFDIIY